MKNKDINSLQLILSPRSDWLLFFFVLLIGGGLAWLSLARYQAYNVDMWDLGNMAQPIWSVTQGRPLEVTSSSGNVSRLAVHVELIYLALVPLYAFWPDPRTLLLVQAIFFALGAYPAYHLGLRATASRGAARAIALAYLLYPAAHSGVLADFHGDTLAMPLLLFALDALEARRWRSYAVWIGLALSCKFYVAAPVAVLGAILLLQPETRKVGFWTGVAAVVYGLFAFVLIRRFFAPDSIGATATSGSVMAYIDYYFTGETPYANHGPVVRLLHALTIFGPLLPAVWRVWWRFLPGIVVAMAALLGSGPASYHSRSHHYALVVPFLIWSLVKSIEVLRIKKQQLNLIVVLGTSLFFITFTSAFLLFILIKTEFIPAGPVADMGLRTERDQFRDQWLANNNPPFVPLATSSHLAPHVLNRNFIIMLNDRLVLDPLMPLKQNIDQIDYALADALYDYQPQMVTRDHEPILWLMEQEEFVVVTAQDGLLRMERKEIAHDFLMQQVKTVPNLIGNTTLATFENRIALQAVELEAVEIEKLGKQRYRLRCDWIALDSLKNESKLIAVSRLAGVAQSRIVHLPTIVMQPTNEWLVGEIIQEEFEFEVPAGIPAGDYELYTGWYDTASEGASRTDAESRIGEEVLLGKISLEAISQ